MDRPRMPGDPPTTQAAARHLAFAMDAVAAGRCPVYDMPAGNPIGAADALFAATLAWDMEKALGRPVISQLHPTSFEFMPYDPFAG